jgi:hypothetical protein
MLRFDVPQVWSGVIRWEAFVNFVVCWLALLVSPWILLLSAAQGLVRGFVGHHRCPSHLLWKRLLEGLRRAGRKENAGAKMFANKLLCVVSLIALALYAAGTPLWRMPVGALIVFSFMEWAFSFCAACWVYGAWYRAFPPRA